MLFLVPRSVLERGTPDSMYSLSTPPPPLVLKLPTGRPSQKNVPLVAVSLSEFLVMTSPRSICTILQYRTVMAALSYTASRLQRWRNTVLLQSASALFCNCPPSVTCFSSRPHTTFCFLPSTNPCILPHVLRIPIGRTRRPFLLLSEAVFLGPGDLDSRSQRLRTYSRTISISPSTIIWFFVFLCPTLLTHFFFLRLVEASGRSL